MPYVNFQHAALNKWSSEDHLEDEIYFMVRYEGRQLHNFVIWILSNPRMHTYERHKAEMARLGNWPHLGDCASEGLWYDDYFTKSCRCKPYFTKSYIQRKIPVTGLELNALVLWERALVLASFAFYARIVLLATHSTIQSAQRASEFAVPVDSDSPGSQGQNLKHVTCCIILHASLRCHPNGHVGWSILGWKY